MYWWNMRLSRNEECKIEYLVLLYLIKLSLLKRQALIDECSAFIYFVSNIMNIFKKYNGDFVSIYIYQTL